VTKSWQAALLDRGVAPLLLIPSLLLLLIILVGPFFYMLWTSFTDLSFALPNHDGNFLGFDKFSRQALPYADTQPYVRAIQQAYGEDRLIWGSDWPFLRARQRMDYGTLLTLAEQQFPDARQRGKVFWKNAAELIGF
jgi:ABC-type sugar transport system permease subunit